MLTEQELKQRVIELRTSWDLPPLEKKPYCNCNACTYKRWWSVGRKKGEKRPLPNPNQKRCECYACEIQRKKSARRRQGKTLSYEEIKEELLDLRATVKYLKIQLQAPNERNP